MLSLISNNNVVRSAGPLLIFSVKKCNPQLGPVQSSSAVACCCLVVDVGWWVWNFAGEIGWLYCYTLIVQPIRSQ